MTAQTPLERDARRCNAAARAAGWYASTWGNAALRGVSGTNTGQRTGPLRGMILAAIADRIDTAPGLCRALERSYENIHNTLRHMCSAQTPFITKTDYCAQGLMHYALTDAGRARMAEMEDGE